MQKPEPTYRTAALAILGLLLTACGGGSGGSGAGQIPNASPQPAFTVTPTSGPAPLTVQFDGSSSNDADGSITHYAWTFGDGSADADGSQVSHVYTASGRFAAQLTVTDNRGAARSRAVTVDVTPAKGTFTLSGRIQILPSSATDSDVNNPATVLIRNDTIAEAQPLPNPVSLGGYLNQPGQGAAGALQSIGDTSDTFHISFAGNETILLSVSDPNASVTLTLLDDAGDVIDATVVAGGSGTLNAPALGGDAYLALDIGVGATTYLLNVGQNTGATAARPARTSDDFVPGELILSGEPAALSGLRRLAGSQGTALYRLDADAHEPPAARALRSVRDGAHLPPNFARKYATLAAIARASHAPSVRHAEPNYIRRANLQPNDSFYSYQWHYPNINLPLAWDVTQGSSQVIVAVIDTGVLVNHPDLTGQLVAGYDFIRDPARARDGNGIDPDANDAGDLGFGGASSFHGTHVAGTVAARSDNASGVAGVAWNTRLMPLRVLGVNGGTSYDVIQALRFAAGLSNDSGTVPPRRADIINLSLGARTSSLAEQSTLDAVRNAGLIVIAAAGNDASSSPSYPAGYAGVTSVAATTITQSRASYSNFGTSIDLAAPGGNFATDVNGDGLGDGIVSTIGDDSQGTVAYGYAALTGTSMAAPHVAGVAALMKAVYPALTPAQFDAALAAGQLTDDLGTPGRDDLFGYGLINAQRAVNHAVELANGAGVPVDPVLVATPGSVNFGPFDSSFDVELRNAGGGTLRILSLATNRPWLSAYPTDIDVTGAGSYRLVVDRSLVTNDGTYTGLVTIFSTANTTTIGVVMQEFSASPSADAGMHYVLLIDTVTDLVVDETAVTASNGEYDFRFDNVGTGQYWIYAGSDSDNDDFICDGGEACGAFRTLDAPESIDVHGDRHSLDFISGFPINLFNLGTASAGSESTMQSNSRRPIKRGPP